MIFIPRRHDVLLALSRDSLDLLVDVLYKVVMLRYNYTNKASRKTLITARIVLSFLAKIVSKQVSTLNRGKLTLLVF